MINFKLKEKKEKIISLSYPYNTYYNEIITCEFKDISPEKFDAIVRIILHDTGSKFSYMPSSHDNIIYSCENGNVLKASWILFCKEKNYLAMSSQIVIM